MKRFVRILINIAALFCAACMLSGCSSYRYLQNTTYRLFSTVTTITVFFGGDSNISNSDANKAIEEAFSSASAVESLFSATVEGSDIYRFNEAAAGEEIEINRATYDALNAVKRIYSLTDGAYNPAVYMLVDLWGFTPRFSAEDYSPSMPYDRADYTAELPAEEYISAFTALTDFSAVNLYVREGKYYVQKPALTVMVDGVEYSMKLDLGGYGKGYAADEMAEVIDEIGAPGGYASVGGSSLCMLSYPYSDEKWNIKLKNPLDPSAGEGYSSFAFESGGLSTSGTYEKYYSLGDRTYSHIIDCATGEPINNGMLTATVAGGSSAECDALTTALCVMGRDKAIEFVNARLTDRIVVFACNGTSGIEVYTNLPADQLTLNEELNFVLCGVGDGAGKIILCS